MSPSRTYLCVARHADRRLTGDPWSGPPVRHVGIRGGISAKNVADVAQLEARSTLLPTRERQTARPWQRPKRILKVLDGAGEEFWQAPASIT